MPLSVQTTPHGQPVPPGAHSVCVAQLRQLALLQVQLWPTFETCWFCWYARQLFTEYAGAQVDAPPPQTLAVPPPPQVAGDVHVPHELTVRDVPQLSFAVTEPQFLPRREQKAVLVSAVQVPPQVPLSVHTAPQGHPVAPGSHEAFVAQFLQLGFAHV